MIRALARLCKALPSALERAHLQWALAEISPLHPDVSYIVLRLAALESRHV